MRGRIGAAVAVAIATIAGACTGSIGDGTGLTGGAGPASGTPGVGGPVADDGTRSDGLCAGVESPTTRLVRLTHTQYDNAVKSLLGLDTTPASTFVPDASFNGFDNGADQLAIGDRLARDYQRAAQTISDAFVASASAYGKIVTCKSGAECARTTVERLVERAFRRPAKPEEVDAYVAAFGKGKEAFASGDDLKDGVHLVVEAILQSPSFLYRAELTDALTADGVIELGPWEIASRLSFMLWNDMPDDALFAAAKSGKLGSAEGVAEEAARMLKDPKSRGPVLDFHRQWLHLDTITEEKLRRDANKFAGWAPSVAPTLRAETLRFVQEVFDGGQSFRDLLTASYTFVNKDTAPLYGVSGTFGNELVKAELDPTKRAGILTQIGFLASRAYFDVGSPIHRGVEIQRHVLCTNLPDPPGDVDLTLPPITGEIKTTRQQVEHHTKPASCAGCHSIINPTGFAFENFDAVGKWRDQENGVPIDSTGTALTGDGSMIAFSGPVDFVKKIAEHPAASSCYAKNWMQYAYGREVRKADGCSVRTLGEKLRSNGYSVKALLGDLTATSAFRYRAAQGGTP
jgi:hypothetical protein